MSRVPSRGHRPYHRLQETVDRIEVHCQLRRRGRSDRRHGSPDGLAAYFPQHFVALERLRSRTMQLTKTAQVVADLVAL